MRRIKLTLLVALLASFYNCAVQSQEQLPPETVQRLDEFLQDLMSTYSVPSLGLAVVKLGNGTNGQIVHTKGYGFQNIEAQVPSTDATLYAIGSITKSFTATLVVKTLNELFPDLGESVLSVPIRQLAPEFNFTLGDRYRSEHVNFKDLLSHRVCIFSDGMSWAYQGLLVESDFNYRQRYAPELCSMRTEFWYHNALVAMAGVIVASMKGSTYDDMLEEFLIDLGMTETTWVKPTDDHNEMANRSVPYYFKDGSFHRYNPELLKGVSVMTGAGGIISSPTDMTKYLQFHLNLGKVEDQQLVPEEVMTWLPKLSNPIGLGIVKTEEEPNAVLQLILGYALGFDVAVYDGFRRVGHSGYLPPYESGMTLYPELGLGIFTTMSGPGTLANLGLPPILVHSVLFDILRGAQIQSGVTPPLRAVSDDVFVANPKTKSMHTSQIPKINPEDTVGLYGCGLSGYMSITLRANDTGGLQPYMLYGKLGTGWLEQVSDNIYSIEWDSDIWQLHWTFLLGPTTQSLYFIDQDRVVFRDDDVEMSDVFVRGEMLDDLPDIPWAPDSCSK